MPFFLFGAITLAEIIVRIASNRRFVRLKMYFHFTHVDFNCQKHPFHKKPVSKTNSP